MMRNRTPPDADRSVYSMLFPAGTPNRSNLSSRFGNETTFDEYTVNLTNLDNGIATNNSNNKSGAVAHEAHKQFSDALHTLGRSETLMVNPIPLLERYSILSEDTEKNLVGRSSEVKALNDFFHKEKYTWKLVWALLNAGQGDDSEMEIHRQLKLPGSDAEEIDDLFDSSCDFRMAQTLVDWLENRYAEERCTSNSATLHAFKESGGMYDATKHLLSCGRTSAGIITELDPDAPLRQSKTLAEQDLEDEQRLYRCVFELIRAGKLIEAQKLAMDQGHFMLAAGILGWKAFKGNIRDEDGEPMPDEGNPYRDVWKIVVWKKLNDDRVTPAEKAIYAALCGNLEMLLPLCQRWEDKLWAHLKTLVDVAIELHLRNVRGADVGQLPENYPKENETLDQILRRLEAQRDLDAGEFFRQLFKFLMLQDREGLLNFMYETCRQMEDIVNKDSHTSHQLRLMTNLALFLRYNGHFEGSSEKIDFIVGFYVQRLIEEGLYEIVPKYVLHLPDKLRKICYLKLLRSLRNLNDRERSSIIEAAQKESIEIYSYLTAFVYETIHGYSENKARDEVTEDDLHKIDALKWLFAQRGHSLLGLKYVNSALRSAILSQRPQAARGIIALVPQESVREMANMVVHMDANETNSMVRESLQSMDTDEDMDSEKNEGSAVEYKKALKEYLCFQEYLEAHLTFDEWFRHYHRERPHEEINSAIDVNSARTALTMEFAKKSYAVRLDTWKSTLNSLCDRAAQHLHCILNYPDGGFLKDAVEDHDDDIEAAQVLDEESRRSEELKALRRICIPQVCSLLHTVLHGTGRFSEAMEIANLIAAETTCLYKEFSREDLGIFLNKVQESSVELLRVPGNSDPYGMGDQ